MACFSLSLFYRFLQLLLRSVSHANNQLAALGDALNAKTADKLIRAAAAHLPAPAKEERNE